MPGPRPRDGDDVTIVLTGRATLVGGESADHGRWMVVLAKCDAPAWRGDGAELFYQTANGSLTSVVVRGGETFEAGPPTLLFTAPFIPGGAARAHEDYDVSKDGQRFLLNLPVSESTPMTAVVNWMGVLGGKP